MPLDTQLFYLLNTLAGQSPFFDSSIVFCAQYLPYILVILFLGVVYWYPHPRREKFEFLAVAAVSAGIARFGITEGIRFFYHHPRPFMELPVHQLITENSWSFPSGHATFFFALATAIYFYDKRWGGAFLAAAALVAVCRVIAGVHFPSDIAAGALLGALTAYGVYTIGHTMAKPSPNQTY